MPRPGRCPSSRLLLPALLFLALLGGGGASLPPGCKQDGRPRSPGRSPAEGKLVCSSLELARVLPPDALPNRTVTLRIRPQHTGF